MTAEVFVSAEDHARIADHASAAYPDECCGVLIGPPPKYDEWRITKVVPSDNVTSGDPRTAFEIDPTLLIRTQKGLRGSGEEIIGYYHSHPNGAAEPSGKDKAGALELEKIWIIAALASKDEPPGLNCFSTTSGGRCTIFKPVFLHIEGLIKDDE